MKDLYEQLSAYGASDYYPFHMPGHKRRARMENPYAIDITEIDGFDDLHHPQGILRESMDRIAALYGADESFFLVNGSTGGILAAISAVTEIGDWIVSARNCHQSVYHAMLLRNLNSAYVYPEVLDPFGISAGIAPRQVGEALRRCPDAKAFVMVSPTYEGIVSDVEAISEILHRHRIPLIVDEAHGAHFRFHEAFPVSALELGADIVIQSLHKTLPCMTQSAILHWKAQPWNDRPQWYADRLRQYLSIYQTSSPSYVLMASMEQGIFWMEREKDRQLQTYVENLVRLREQFRTLRHIHLLDEEDCKPFSESGRVFCDIGKLVFGTKEKRFSGKWLYEMLLHRYHLQMELCTPDYCIAMTSAMDSEEGWQRLGRALWELDAEIEEKTRAESPPKEEKTPVFQRCLPQTPPDAVMSCYEAGRAPKRKVRLTESAGMISGEAVLFYPPGIPIVLPGERITDGEIRKIRHFLECGFLARGMADPSGTWIAVL